MIVIKPRILIYGNKFHGSYEYFWYQWLLKKRFVAEIFDHNEYLRKLVQNIYLEKFLWRFGKSFLIYFISNIFKKIALDFDPDLVIVVNGRLVNTNAIEAIKRNSRAKVFHFYGEDYFNRLNTTVALRNAACHYDHFFTTKSINVDELKKIGIKKISFLPFGYIPSCHYPCKVAQCEILKYGSDLVFVGTWEKERAHMMEKLADFNLKIWGNQWLKLSNNSPLRPLVQNQTVFCKDMSKVFNASRICLSFLRKANRDLHTSRTFEIPACGGFQLSERTVEVTRFFKEGKEIECFSSSDELIEKIRYYLKNDHKRKLIAQAGLERIYSSKYSYSDRLETILAVYRNQ
jgi:hypothetical protein